MPDYRTSYPAWSRCDPCALGDAPDSAFPAENCRHWVVSQTSDVVGSGYIPDRRIPDTGRNHSHTKQLPNRLLASGKFAFTATPKRLLCIFGVG